MVSIASLFATIGSDGERSDCDSPIRNFKNYSPKNEAENLSFRRIISTNNQTNNQVSSSPSAANGKNFLKFSVDRAAAPSRKRRVVGDPAAPASNGAIPKKSRPLNLTLNNVKTSTDCIVDQDVGSPDEPPAPTPTSKNGVPLVWPAWVYCTRYSDRPSSDFNEIYRLILNLLYFPPKNCVQRKVKIQHKKIEIRINSIRNVQNSKFKDENSKFRTQISIEEINGNSQNKRKKEEIWARKIKLLGGFFAKWEDAQERKRNATEEINGDVSLEKKLMEMLVLSQNKRKKEEIWARKIKLLGGFFAKWEDAQIL
uniref:Uncharacterized protein n=1 Tax=Romanomermis culicivorax TaxID=13658 RepID=A0A915IL30_ROMCU